MSFYPASVTVSVETVPGAFGQLCASRLSCDVWGGVPRSVKAWRTTATSRRRSVPAGCARSSTPSPHCTHTSIGAPEPCSIRRQPRLRNGIPGLARGLHLKDRGWILPKHHTERPGLMGHTEPWHPERPQRAWAYESRLSSQAFTCTYQEEAWRGWSGADAQAASNADPIAIRNHPYRSGESCARAYYNLKTGYC